MAIVNLDVDGVVCGFSPHLFKTLELDGFDVASLPEEIYTVWDIFSLMPPDMKRHAFDLLSHHLWWEGIPVIEGAIEGVQSIRDAGHRIHWITSPWTACFGWANARSNWLDAHFDHPEQSLSKDLTVAGDKSFSDADVYVDDRPSNLRSWLAHFDGIKHQGVLYLNSHNAAEAAEFPYTSSWDNGLADLVIKLAGE